MVAAAVNVTEAPLQIVCEPAVMLMTTEGGVPELIVIVMALLVAVAGEIQPALLVITTVTISLLAKPVEVNVLLLVPALTPLIFH